MHRNLYKTNNWLVLIPYGVRGNDQPLSKSPLIFFDENVNGSKKLTLRQASCCRSQYCFYDALNFYVILPSTMKARTVTTISYSSLLVTTEKKISLLVLFPLTKNLIIFTFFLPSFHWIGCIL
jgi:hypothetical protein